VPRVAANQFVTVDEAAIGCYRSEQVFQIPRVVLSVSVRVEDVVFSRSLKPAPERCSISLISRVRNNAKVGSMDTS